MDAQLSQLLCGCCRSRFHSALRGSPPQDAFLLDENANDGKDRKDERDDEKVPNENGEFDPWPAEAATAVNGKAGVAGQAVAAGDEMPNPDTVPAPIFTDGPPHDFQLVSVYVPTTCDSCNHLLLGLWNQGYRCQSEDCGQVVCHECVESVPLGCPFIREDSES